jgi:hypothetical protein
MLDKTHIHHKIPTNLTRFANHGVIYSRHKCLSSILETLNPWMHSSKNSRVRWGSFVASFSLTDLMKSVLFDGMHIPKTERKKFNRL